MKEKFLPIGSVVILKNATKKLMITGFCIVPNEEPNKQYDYSGCLYPEGFLSSKQTAVFNHDQIDKIFHMGYESDEEKEFKQKLNAALENIKAANAKMTQASDVETLDFNQNN